MSNPNFYKRHMTKAQCPPLADIYYKTFGEKTDGTFVEVGAFNGVNWSATHGLAKIGWNGLLFEPNREYYNACSTIYQNNENVIVENCAILDYNGKVKLYLGGSLSTTSEERVKVYQTIKWAKGSRLDLDRFDMVNAFTLDHMFEKHKIPADFEMLVIDVEGAEAQVLKGLSFDKWRPKLMMIETHEKYEDSRLSKTAIEIYDIVWYWGYVKLFANHINTVYRRENGEA